MIYMTNKIRIRGYKATLPFYPKANKAFNHGLVKSGNMAIAKYTYRSMRRRVPMRTGFLRDSIDIKVKKQTSNESIITSRIKAPYAAAQEFGYINLIPIDYIFQHMEAPGSRGVRVENLSGYAFPTKFTPFVGPAIKSLMRNMRRIQDRTFNKELKKQGFVSKTIRIK